MTSSPPGNFEGRSENINRLSLMKIFNLMNNKAEAATELFFGFIILIISRRSQYPIISNVFFMMPTCQLINSLGLMLPNQIKIQQTKTHYSLLWFVFQIYSTHTNYIRSFTLRKSRQPFTHITHSRGKCVLFDTLKNKND